jgi:hypothetical protein
VRISEHTDCIAVEQHGEDHLPQVGAVVLAAVYVETQGAIGG